MFLSQTGFVGIFDSVGSESLASSVLPLTLKAIFEGLNHDPGKLRLVNIRIDLQDLDLRVQILLNY
jgi:hypothetical protein